MPWREPSPWDDDDPAIRLMRQAHALLPPPEPVERPRTAETAQAAPPEPPPVDRTRRERVAALLERVRAGDLSAVESLRRILG